MPEIIKYGKEKVVSFPCEDIEIKPITLMCEYCGTVAKFKTNEFFTYKYESRFRRELLYKTTCPICGKDIICISSHGGHFTKVN